MARIAPREECGPTNDQLHKMRTQIRLLKQAPELTGDRQGIGVIVHRERRLETPLQPTEHGDVLRATPRALTDLLLAKRLPGEHPPPATTKPPEEL